MQVVRGSGPTLTPAEVPRQNSEHQRRKHQSPCQQGEVGHAPGPKDELIADRLIRTVVDALAQVLARFEVRHMLAGQGDGFAGFRISALSWRPKMQREAAKTTYFDALACRQRIAHDFQELFDGQFDILRRQMLLLGRNDLNEFRFRHYRSVGITSHTFKSAGAAKRCARLSLQSWPEICSFKRSPKLVPVGESVR